MSPLYEAGGEKAKGIRSMIEELPYVRFELEEKEFYDYQFLPVGIKKAKGGFHQAEAIAPFRDSFSLHELFVMSPFLSKEIICAFNNHNTVQNARHLLITRESSLEKLNPSDADRFQIYTLRDEIIDGESAISGDGQAFQKQDIHAKVYMTRKDSDSDLYLGSLNASHNAVSGNVEFMLRLRAKNRYLNLDKLTAALFGGEQDGNPFQEVSLRNAQTEQEDEIQNDLEEVIKRIDRSNPIAHIEADGEKTFKISICFGECDTKGLSVQIRPLLSEHPEPFQNIIVFSNLHLTDLSDFYVAAVSDGERTVKRVLVIPTEGMPENREKAVVSGVVSNEDCFYRYVAFLLGENAILSILDAEAATGAANGTLYRGDYHIPALYEKMLRTAAAAPEKFEGIEYLMRAISENGIIPDDFKRLYELFRRVVKLRGKSR